MNEFPPSKAPRFQFAETLEEQENQLRRNPLLQRMREARREESGRPPSTPVPLRQPGVRAERPQRAVLLAGPLASLLPGAAAGGSPPALGPRRQPGSHPLAGPSVCHWSRPGGQVLLRHHPGGGGPGDRHVPRRGRREHGGRFPRPPAVELAQGDGTRSHTIRVRGRTTPAVRGLRSLHLAGGRRLLRPLRRDRARPTGGQAYEPPTTCSARGTSRTGSICTRSGRGIGSLGWATTAPAPTSGPSATGTSWCSSAT